MNASAVMAEEGRNMLSLCGRGVSSHSENVHFPFLEASRRGVPGLLNRYGFFDAGLEIPRTALGLARGAAYSQTDAIARRRRGLQLRMVPRGSGSSSACAGDNPR